VECWKGNEGQTAGKYREGSGQAKVMFAAVRFRNAFPFSGNLLQQQEKWEGTKRYNCTFVKGEKGKYQLVVSEKGWNNLKLKIKIITRKTTPATFDERIHKLKELHRGWLGYYRIASISGKLKDMDGWIRNRLRYCIWQNWKKPERKRKNFIRLGVDQEHAFAWSRTRKGGWAVA
jgi:hypothetical protein